MLVYHILVIPDNLNGDFIGLGEVIIEGGAEEWPPSEDERRGLFPLVCSNIKGEVIGYSLCCL